MNEADKLRLSLAQTNDALAQAPSEVVIDVAALLERMAELERHNALLKAIAIETSEYYGLCIFCQRITGHDDDCPYKAAIDGGALGE